MKMSAGKQVLLLQMHTSLTSALPANASLVNHGTLNLDSAKWLHCIEG